MRENLVWFDNIQFEKDSLSYVYYGMPDEFLDKGISSGLIDEIWLIRIDAEDNTDLCLDGESIFCPQKLAKLQDLIVQFEYTYEMQF